MVIEKKIKVLNLYAGIGGNRKLWDNDKVEVTAVENIPEIAKIYKDFFPDDKVIVTDAHQYLLDHFEEFDFIWSSPPCPTHSKAKMPFMVSGQQDFVYPDMKLYEEIIFLKHFFKGKWVVENVVSYYKPLIPPYWYKGHYYWSNFIIPQAKKNYFRGHDASIETLQELKGFDVSSYKFISIDKKKLLRNCVEPKSGLFVFNCAFKERQEVLNGDFSC